MKIIIYFGHHKVGSTALQAYFAGNALALLKQGILYPAVESQGMSHLLAQALGQHASPDLSCMNVREPHNALGFKMLAHKNKGKTPAWHGPLPGLPAMITMIRHQADVLKPHTIILCSEVFSNFGTGHKDMITRLRNIFPDAEYELYCALRRPDEYMTSWYGQRLRFGHKLRPFAEWGDLDSIHFNYRKMVEPWVKIFDESTIHIRNYSDILTAGGSVQDFTAQVGCKFPKGLSEKGPSNAGLPRIAYEILRRGNSDLSDDQAQRLRSFFLALPKAVLPVRDSDVELFGAARRAELADAFAPIHDYLNEVTGKDAFFPDIEQMRQTRSVPAEEATRKLLNGFAGSILPRLPKAELSEYISELKSKL